jgi:hypothetical protein
VGIHDVESKVRITTTLVRMMSRQFSPVASRQITYIEHSPGVLLVDGFGRTIDRVHERGQTPTRIDRRMHRRTAKVRLRNIESNATLKTSLVGRSHGIRSYHRLSGFRDRRRGFDRSSGARRCGMIRLGASRGLSFRGARACCRGRWGSFRRLQGQAEERQGEGEGEESSRASHDRGDTPPALVGPNFRTDHFIRSGYQGEALVALGAYEQGLPERP